MISARPFPGTDEECKALLLVAEHHCACYVDSEGVRQSTCSLHQWWLDPRGVPHLIFARRLARHWIVAEFMVDQPPVLGGTF